MNEHAVFEAHPDYQVPDLRLDVPFPDLIKYCESFDLDNMDSAKHKHIPYIVPMYLTLKTWRENNDNRIPNYKEKKEIKTNFNKMR
jgi:amyloid beta precursor protein binding protein 1